MTDKEKAKCAQKAYKTLCAMLDGNKYRYDKDAKELAIHIVMNGKDIPMDIVIKIDSERSLVRLMSFLPLTFTGDKRVEACIATSQVNYWLIDGSFDFNYEKGKVAFRMTASFRDSVLSKEAFGYMLHIACQTVDEFNDQFLALSKGYLTLDAFLKK